jgi:hypothetical protein
MMDQLLKKILAKTLKIKTLVWGIILCLFLCCKSQNLQQTTTNDKVEFTNKSESPQQNTPDDEVVFTNSGYINDTKKEKPAVDYSNTECEPLYDEFLSINLASALESYSSKKPYDLIKGYYECLNFKNPGKYDSYLEKLKKYIFISNEDGVLIAKSERKGYVIEDYYLLDYELNVIKEFPFISHFRNDITFVQIKLMEMNEFTDPYLKKDGSIKLNSFFHYRLINKQGEFIDDERYHDRVFLDNGYLQVKWTLYYGILDASGKVVVPLKYHDLGVEKGGFIPAQLAGKWGVIDFKNNIIAPFEYDFDGVYDKLDELVRGN